MSGDGSGWQLRMHHVCCVKRNDYRLGARKQRQVLAFGKPCKILWRDQQHRLCAEVLEDEHERKNEREALHIQSVPGHLVNILPSDL